MSKTLPAGGRCGILRRLSETSSSIDPGGHYGKPVVHWELWSKDPEKMSNFYEKIFGWKIQHMPELDYRMVDTGGAGGINGGIMKPQHEGPWPGNMTFYVDVDDLAAYRKKIVAAGGTIMVDDQEVPGMDRLCLFTDPEGRMLGLWKGNSGRKSS